MYGSCGTLTMYGNCDTYKRVICDSEKRRIRELRGIREGYGANGGRTSWSSRKGFDSADSGPAIRYVSTARGPEHAAMPVRHVMDSKDSEGLWFKVWRIGSRV
eukprot:588956-Rhodomonas_salina.1